MKDRATKESKFFSIPQVAALLGISRIAVYKQVKSGGIKAIRMGRSYAIPRSYILQVSGGELSPQRKTAIRRAVKKTVKQYGELIIKLGNE